MSTRREYMLSDRVAPFCRSPHSFTPCHSVVRGQSVVRVNFCPCQCQSVAVSRRRRPLLSAIAVHRPDHLTSDSSGGGDSEAVRRG